MQQATAWMPMTAASSAMSSIPFGLLIGIVIVAVIVWFAVQTIWTTPRFHRVFEGFRSAEVPSCLRTLPEAHALLDAVQAAADSAEYREIVLILSKLACLKEDLEGAAQSVNATRTVAFETAHDRMAVAELCGMCFTHGLSARDLDISFETWRDRGNLLLRKLCTLANMSEAEVLTVEGQFKTILERVYGVAKGRCLVQLAGENPGDVRGVETAATRAYEGRASGWNGTI